MNEEIILIFKKLLIIDNPQISKITLKNYLSDLRHFINWYTKSLKRNFTPMDISRDIITLYQKSNGCIIENGELVLQTKMSDSSIRRHISSLKKFFLLINREDSSITNPFENDLKKKSYPTSKIWHLEEFKDTLLSGNASMLTVKNYMSDIQNFAKWYEDEIMPRMSLSNPETANAIFIDQSILDSYKESLFDIRKSAIRSINRRLSSLRKYLDFCQKNGILNNAVFTISNIPLDIKKSTPLQQTVD